MVSNYAYTRFDRITPSWPASWPRRERVDDGGAGIDKAAAELYKSDLAAAAAMVTQFSYDTGARAVKDWLAFWQHLFTTFVDGEETQADASNAVRMREERCGLRPAVVRSHRQRDRGQVQGAQLVAAERDAVPRTLSKARMLGQSRRAGTLRS